MYKYLVEFLGTLLFVATISFSGNPLLIVGAFAVTAAFGGKISGAHFNPAVSLWAWLSSKLSTNELGLYVLAQISAAAVVWMLGELSS